jgi:signal transduction histidine kinase
MTQVLVNLLSNAMKYSPQGSNIRLEAGQLGGEAIVSIRDEGVGIAKLELERIFKQFYRVSASKEGAQGIGLGLYISKQFVDGHNGRIWAESEIGKGSTFYVSFPVERA